MQERAPVSAPAAPTRVPVVAAAKTPTPVPASTPARAVPTSTVAKPTATATKSAPTPVAPTAKPTVASAAPAAKAAAKPAAKPGTAPSTGSNNIATLPPQGGSQIAKAESFARSRGCKVQPGRTIVHKRDADADFLRVYCVGDPPFLVKCSGGRCKLIE